MKRKFEVYTQLLRHVFDAYDWPVLGVWIAFFGFGGISMAGLIMLIVAIVEKLR